MVSSPKRKAWQLATCPHPAVRDALKAVELATSSPPDQRDADAWRTLGAAQYYAGNAQDAIDALNKSIVLRTGDKALGALNRFIELRTRDKCLDWFFLAMAQQQLDKKEDARRFYDRATEWMEKNKPGNPDLRRFRAEAAKVLGIEEKGLPK